MADEILLEWQKGDDERRDRFKAALVRSKAVRVELIRSLCDEWAKLVLAPEVGDIERAASTVARRKG